MAKILLFLCIFCVSASYCDATKPNIILILTDDQDIALGGLVPMIKTSSLMRRAGVQFPNAFATTPVCCPARSSLLTGLYQRNHHVFNNSRSGNCYGNRWQNLQEKTSLGAMLQSAGYKTFYAGKYLNEYHGTRVPPGWDWWAGLLGNSVYYNYTININGTLRSFGDKPEDYLTDVLAGWAQDFLKVSHQQPFFMVIATPAAHEPFTPSNKYKGYYKKLYAPRVDNFNRGRENKHWLVRSSPALHRASVEAVDEVFRSRWETLRSVDDLVSDVMKTVPEDSYVLLTSDHGFHMGQFSMPWDKRQPYETDIRVPLVVWGPLVAAGSTQSHPVLNIDIAPTLYEIAGVRNPPRTDGSSFLPLLHSQSDESGRRFFVEYHGEGGSGSPCYADKELKLCHPQLQCKCFDARNNTYTCVRTITSRRNSLICKFYDDEGFIESYDLVDDPWQLHNLAVNGK